MDVLTVKIQKRVEQSPNLEKIMYAAGPHELLESGTRRSTTMTLVIFPVDLVWS